MADTMLLYILILFPLVIFTAIILYNFFTAPRLKNENYKSEEKPLISILIPARNEEKNIAECLNSVLNQTYKNYEVIVLDDNSVDNTKLIVKKYLNEKVKLIEGAELPTGWLGKNWACYQLSKTANGKLFLFLDADVRLHVNTVNAAVNVFYKYKLKMLSVFPVQKISSFGEYLIVPLLNWLLLTFLPLRKVYTSKRKSFSAAIGQFIIIDKNTYNEIGGHKSVKNKIVEDLEIARNLKSRGYKIMSVLGSGFVECRMYENFTEAFKGFSKNFYPAFNSNILNFLLLVLFLIVTFLSPFILVFYELKFLFPVILILLGRIMIAQMSEQSKTLNVVLHPLQMLVMIVTAINSVLWTLNKRSEWKGRKIN